MKTRGISTRGIVEDLKKQGLSYKESEDTFNQAGYSSSGLQPSMMEQGAEEMPPPPVPEEPQREYEEEQTYNSEPSPEQFVRQQPAQQFIPTQPIRTEIENVEILIENIVEEKFQRMLDTYGDIGSWKDKVRTEILAIKQELLRIRSKLESTEQAVLGRVNKYDKDIMEVGTDVKALEKVLQNILKPLTTSIKELQVVTKKLKR